MILCDNSIRKLVKEQSIIEPFNEENLQSESYDVTIGEKITVMKKEIHCIDLLNQSSIDTIYDEINLDKSGYVISPKEYLLISLKEKITVPEGITAHIRNKTRFVRLGLLIADQHCNSTYSGHLRLGVFNATDYPIKIYPGLSIAQIVFETLDGKPTEEKLYSNKTNASYQNENGKFIGAKFDDLDLDEMWRKMLK